MIEEDLEYIKGKTILISEMVYDSMNPKIEITFTDGSFLEIEAEHFYDITLRND